MKKQLMTGLFTVLALTAGAQTFQEWRNPEINAVNRAPMHRTTLLLKMQMQLRKRTKTINQLHDFERNLEVQLGEGCGFPPH